MPKLLVKAGEKKGLVYRLMDKEVSIGRYHANQIVLPDRRMSRLHARIIPQGDEYMVEDLKSANGVQVNGKDIDQKVLRYGDEITMGSTTLVYLALNAPEDFESKSEAHRVQFVEQQKPSEIMTMEVGAHPHDGLALNKSDSHETVSKAYQRLMALYQVAYELSALMDLSKLMDHILDLVLNMVNADRGFIMLCDEESGELVLQTVRQREGVQSTEELSVSKTILDQVVSSGEAVMTTDAAQDPRFKEAQSIVAHGIRSAMCVPLRVKDKVLGVLNVDTKGKVVAFKKEDLELLSAVSSQAAIAIENAKLFDELIKANKELKEQQAQLIESEKLSALGQLASGVAHEINNPMTSILGYSELSSKQLDQENLAPETIKQCIEFMRIVQSEALRCRGIVQSLLQYARKKKAQKIASDINSVIGSSLTIAQFHIRRVSIQIKQELQEGLPVIMTDPNQLQQVFLNMIINARDAMADGGTLTISTEKRDDKWVVIKFADTGCGIPKDKMDKIFKPLFTTKEEGKGTGLGLSITLDIIDRHGGSVEVDSEEGKGTTFSILLPIEPPEEKEEEAKT